MRQFKYSCEDRIRAVKLYIKLDKRIAAILIQLGYPTKNPLKTDASVTVMDAVLVNIKRRLQEKNEK